MLATLDARLDSSGAPASAADLAGDAQKSDVIGLIAAAHHRDFRGPLIAFCVTLYNEPGDSLRATLASIAKAASLLHRQTRFHNRFSVICIVADGLDSLASNTRNLLLASGFFQAQGYCSDLGVDLYSSVRPAPALLNALDISGYSDILDLSEPLRLVLCVKQRNLGKLDSHALFFNGLCRALDPSYCFQIDTGTSLDADTVLRLIEEMEGAPSVAALAPKVMPSMPRSCESLLAAWQYVDFALRNALVWPFEVATGHLSVLPGQASLIRWQALQPPGGIAAPAGETPLASYLTGRLGSGAVKRIMYLAEDRVIGTQLVSARENAWTLGYIQSAEAVTDSCTTFRELFRQRRRWYNAALASRIWMLGQFWSYIFRPDRTSGRKCLFCLSVIAQGAIAIRELLFPSLTLSVLLSLAAILLSSGSGLTEATHAAFVAAILLRVALLYVRRPATAPWRTGLSIAITACRMSVSMLFVASLLTASSLKLDLMLIGPVTGLLLLRTRFSGTSWLLIVDSLIFPIPHLLMTCSLSACALWNLQDTSWGTKGLTHSVIDASAARPLRNFRNFVVTLWIVVNAVVVICAANAILCRHALLAPVMWCEAGLEFLMAMVAACTLR